MKLPISTRLKTLAAICACAAAVLPVASARAENYMLTDNWGGQWQDVEKSYANTDDDDLCWAAAAANVLYWGGWTDVAGESFSSADDVFDYYIDHWNDAGSLPSYAWQWWISGYNPKQGASGWAQVTNPGGGFFQDKSFYDYYSSTTSNFMAMNAVYNYLTTGSGVTLAIYRDTGSGLQGHAISVWGIDYDLSVSMSNFTGLWVTDSDNQKYSSNPSDMLQYYDVAYDSVDGKWYLQDFYGSDQWYVSAVQSLKAVPEPSTLMLLTLGAAAITKRHRKRQ